MMMPSGWVSYNTVRVLRKTDMLCIVVTSYVPHRTSWSGPCL